jgi:hypothetical protein
MNFLHALFPFLEELDNGTILKKIFTLLFESVGWILLILLPLISIVSVFKALQMPGINFKIVVVLIVMFVLVCSFGYIVSQIHFYHSRKIRRLPPSPFTITPVIIEIIRMTGEILAAFMIMSGIISTAVAILVNFNDYTFTEFSFSNYFPSFIEGPYGILIGLLVGFFTLILFYFFSEIYYVLIDIALNIRRLNKPDSPTIDLSHEINEPFH